MDPATQVSDASIKEIFKNIMRLMTLLSLDTDTHPLFWIGEDNFHRMVNVLNENSEWWLFLVSFNDPKGFMLTDVPTFKQICKAFYADGRRSIDNGIVFLCRYMQFIAEHGVSAFDECMHNAVFEILARQHENVSQ